MGFIHISNALARKRKNMKMRVKFDPSKEKNSQTNGSQQSESIITDPRFSSLHYDPRFQKIPQRELKVAIDSRFDQIFLDKSFTSTSAHDKRGKRKRAGTNNLLHRYYRISRNGEDGELAVGGVNWKSSAEGKNNADAAQNQESDGSDESSTSSTETDTGSDEDDIGVEDGYMLQEEDIPMIEDETHRLAIVNMDWNYVKATDLYVLLSSFLPEGGHIVSVAIYPSEFGVQRMEAEALHGPIGLFDEDADKYDDSSDEDVDKDDGSSDEDEEFDNEKLRRYEISRLRYYYAAVVCNSSSTASYLYRACDGVELERTSTVLDLRFIPDSMELKYPPRDIAKELPVGYERLDFHTRALQQSKVDLSWDQDEPQRTKTLKRKFNPEQLAELDLKEYLASDESDLDGNSDYEATEDPMEKKHKKQELYRSLLQQNDASDTEEDGDCQEMQVTFNTGLEDLSKRILEKKEKGSETVWEADLRKRREKKKAKKNKTNNDDDESIGKPGDFLVDKEGEAMEASRAELELLVADDKEKGGSPKGYNMKPRKKGKIVLEQDEIHGAVHDPRFSAIFTSPSFAMDPTDPQFKRSATYFRQLAQKQHDRKHPEAAMACEVEGEAHLESSRELPNEKVELSSFVKSVKAKAKQSQLPAKRVNRDNIRRAAPLAYVNRAGQECL